MEEITAFIAKEKVDALIVAGDVYDTVNPPAEAESLFYSTCLRISRYCPVVAIAGNHDNPERLAAPDGIAGECGILLGGGTDYSHAKIPFEGGEGFVRLTSGKEKVNLALLPYPSAARMSALGYTVDPEKNYTEHVREWLSICARGFTASDCNITVSHLFMSGSERASDEVELGAAALLPCDVLPDAHYTALGHIHKPQCVSKKRNVYYSGSLLKYSFDDTSDKYFNLIETSPAGVKLTRVPITGGRNLVTVTVTDFDGCIAALREHEDAYLRILYDCADPISSNKYAELRGFENFAQLRNVYASPKAERKQCGLKSDREMFIEFYTTTRGEKPSESLIELFERAMRGEKL